MVWYISLMANDVEHLFMFSWPLNCLEVRICVKLNVPPSPENLTNCEFGSTVADLYWTKSMCKKTCTVQPVFLKSQLNLLATHMKYLFMLWLSFYWIVFLLWIFYWKVFFLICFGCICLSESLCKLWITVWWKSTTKNKNKIFDF